MTTASPQRQKKQPSVQQKPTVTKGFGEWGVPNFLKVVQTK